MATNEQSLDRAAAKINPEDHFESPHALVNDVILTRAEKLTALANWHLSVERRLVAGSEGMPTAGKATDDSELMRQIDIARMQLEKA